MNFARALLLGLAALPMAAQAGPFSVSGSLILGLDSYKKVVNQSTGLFVSAGMDARLGKAPARFSLGVGAMPGKEANGLKTSLTLLQLSGDLLIPTSVDRLQAVFGLSLNRYTAQRSGEESLSPLDVDHHFPFTDVEGIKGGLRLGLEYRFQSRFTAELLLQATELAGRQRMDPLIRKGGLNPAWIQCGVRYSF